MSSGQMTVKMSIPTTAPDLSFQCSGSLSAMNLNELNQFLEVAEHASIKSGILQEAAFDIDVAAGHASGNLRGVYEDLCIVLLDKRTGSDSGIANQVVSFVANNVKLRGTNMPDETGNIKIGEVNYTRKPRETFTKFVWFALRSGVGDVVGF